MGVVLLWLAIGGIGNPTTHEEENFAAQEPTLRIFGCRLLGGALGRGDGPAQHEVTDGHVVLRPAKMVGPYLEFLRTPDVQTVPERVHLGLLPYPGDGKAAEVARLRALDHQDETPWQSLLGGLVEVVPEVRGWVVRGAGSPTRSI